MLIHHYRNESFIILHKLLKMRLFLLAQSMNHSANEYFERQDLFSLQCGRHSINNVLGEHLFTKDRMNDLCFQLSADFINPHKHPFGGDYDANVLMLALQEESCITRWHDRRKRLNICLKHEGKTLVGFLVNKFRKPNFLHTLFRVSPRHWIAIRREDNKYYFMDSKEEGLQIFQKQDAEKRINEMLNEFNDTERRAEVIEVFGEQKNNAA